jgi:integrator complex subunit 11
MTTPTMAIIPYMLEDFRRVILDIKFVSKNDHQNKYNNNQNNNNHNNQNDSENLFIYSQTDINNCMKKVSSLNLHETYIEQGIKIKTYYAGHVLGACMFFIQYRDIKVVYTGDFNSCADRHLGAAWI